MVSLDLDECVKMDTGKILMYCHKDNIASAKIIIKNSGVLKNEIMMWWYKNIGLKEI